MGPPPNQYGPPPKKGMGGGAIAVIILAVVLVVGLLGGGGYLAFKSFKGKSDPVSISTSSSDDDSSDSPDTPTPTPSPTPLFTDDGYEAQVDQCFTDSGTQSSPNLTLDSGCTPGSYKVVQRISATTDTKRCGGDKNHSNYSVYYDDPSDDSNDLVLCLNYQYTDPAGSAIVGECVYGTSTSTSWRTSTCEPGAFEVIAKYYGTTSYDKCREHSDYREGISYTNSSRPELNVVICTKYLYQDDAAYTKKNNCVKVKNEGSSWWMHFSDCDKANAIVTGYTGKYQPKFCGNDGWVGYEFPDRGFKHLDYTVCWRKYP
jgi:hypothetical protein